MDNGSRLPSVDLLELERLFAATTQGEYDATVLHADAVSGSPHPGVSVGLKGADLNASKGWVAWLDTEEDNKANAAFLAAVHNAFPALVERIRKAEAALRESLILMNERAFETDGPTGRFGSNFVTDHHGGTTELPALATWLDGDAARMMQLDRESRALCEAKEPQDG